MTLEQALAALAELNKKLDAQQSELEKLRSDAKRRDDSALVDMQKQLDATQGARDELAKQVKDLEDNAKTQPTTDELVVRKMAIVDGARLLHGKADAVDVTKSERDIMIAAIAARDASFKADGKSDDYVRARFDMAVEQQKKAGKSMADAMRGTGAGGAGATVTAVDGGDELERLFKAYDAAPDRIFKSHRDGYLGDEETKRLESLGLTRPPQRPEIYRERFDARDMMQRIDAWLAQVLPQKVRDADPSTMFFPRQLMYIMTTPYEFRYPDIKYPEIFPISYEVPTGARTYSWHMYDELGQADIVDDYADEAPNVERKGIELIGKIIPVRDSYSYSIQDIRSGNFANVPIEAMKSVTARRLIERKCDALAAIGDATRSIKGAANDGNVPTYTLATKAAGGTKWGNLSGGTVTYNATPEEILRDVGGMRTSILLNTSGAIEPDTLVLGTQNTSVIDTLRLDQFNMTTVGAYLRNALPWLKNIYYWPRLDTAGASNKERIILCKRDPSIFRFVIPQEFEQFPPEPRNLSFVINCHKRWAEPQMIQPKGFIYADGSTQ